MDEQTLHSFPVMLKHTYLPNAEALTVETPRINLKARELITEDS